MGKRKLLVHPLALLVLSHITANTEDNLHEVRRLIRDQGFRGEISTAQDKEVINLLN